MATSSSGPTDKLTPQIRLVLSTSPNHNHIDGDLPDHLSTRSGGRSLRRTVLRGLSASSDDSDSRISTRSSTPATRTDSDAEKEERDRDSDGNRKSGGGHHILPASPRLERIEESPSPIFVLNSGAGGSGLEAFTKEDEDLDLGMAALDIDEPAVVQNHGAHTNGSNAISHSSAVDNVEDIVEVPARVAEEREIVVSLPSDMAFFELLCEALVSLSQLHERQQQLFNTSVAHLCSLISNSIEPQSSSSLIKKIHLPSPSSRRKAEKPSYDPAHTPGSSSYHKSDLYVWREIFTLWIEAQIFESSSERDRGERTIDGAERRLKAFAAEVLKRGLGDRRTLRRKESRMAWEEFLRLNVLLLDLKRFQIANINAARK